MEQPAVVLKAKGITQERGPIDLMEESCHLLRRVPASCLAAYIVGVVPFILGLLYFTSDMSRSAFASGHVGSAALGLTLLFFWMKAWQTVYAGGLMAMLSGKAPTPWTLGRVARMVSLQVFIQPLGLFVLPVALLILLPFGWAVAFFANTTVLGDGTEPLMRHDLARIWKQTILWPGQNHVLLLTYKMLMGMVILNLALTLAGLPWLLKMLFGIETAFTLSPWSMFNTTFFLCLMGLTYLCLDPLIKAAYVLRCFYGESLKSGLDLKVDLAPFRKHHARAGLLLMLMLTFVPMAGRAATAENGNAGPPVTDTLRPGELDQSITEVIRQREYSWRLPREGLPDDENASKSALARFMDSMVRGLESGLKQIGQWMKDLVNWIQLGKLTPSTNGGGPGYDWFSPLRFLLILLIAALVVMLGVLLYRSLKKRRSNEAAIVVTPMAPAVPDVADESVGADQLPDDEWLLLARQLVAEGNLRLAMRAFYLASLAHLAHHNLIALAKFKSNHEYERELNRRAHALPQLPPLFRQNINAFDRVWYGDHAVTPDGVEAFASTVDEIRRQS